MIAQRITFIYVCPRLRPEGQRSLHNPLTSTRTTKLHNMAARDVLNYIDRMAEGERLDREGVVVDLLHPREVDIAALEACAAYKAVVAAEAQAQAISFERMARVIRQQAS